MKRVSRLLLLALFGLLVLGGTRSFAGPKPKPGGNTGGNIENIIKTDEGFIQQLLNDIFGDPKSGNGGSGGSGGGSWSGNPGTGPTAPIDGGISLLLAAGIGLGMKKMANRKNANTGKE